MTQLEALHNHLRLHSGDTFGQMWGDLERLRRLGVAHEDLPADRATLLAGLQTLLANGLAEKSGEIWLWVRKEVKPQKELFA